jgi:hypothetical protein
MNKTAVISDCGKYRYELFRGWNYSEPKILFIMLNPSTADAQNDDPTIRRCMGFAKSWQYGGFYVANLFALRATNPKEIYKAADPIGKDNLFYLHRAAVLQCNGEVICAWGNHGRYKNIGNQVLEALWDWGVVPNCFGLTKKGQPKHPLYLKNETELIKIPRKTND